MAYGRQLPFASASGVWVNQTARLAHERVEPGTRPGNALTIGLWRNAHHSSGLACIEIKDCVDHVGQALFPVERHQHRLRAAQRHLPRFEFVLRGQGYY